MSEREDKSQTTGAGQQGLDGFPILAPRHLSTTGPEWSCVPHHDGAPLEVESFAQEAPGEAKARKLNQLCWQAWSCQK